MRGFTCGAALLTLLVTLPGASALRAEFWKQDATFAPVLESPQIPLDQKLVSVVQQPDGKLLAAGYVERVNGQTRADATAVMRFNANGTLDPTFQAQTSASALFLQPSGKIVTREGLRLNADGSRDATFHLPADAYSVATIDALGRLYVLRGDNTLFRTLVDGAIDPSFNTALRPEGDQAIAPFADGSVAIAAKVKWPYYTALTILRLRPDGTEDPNFARYAVWTLMGLIPLPDGRLLIYDSVTSEAGIAMKFVRLGINGVADYTYVGPGSHTSGVTRADAFIVAGVLYDLLQDAHAPPGTHLQVAFPIYWLFTGAFDVSADGSLWLAFTEFSTPGDVARYARSSPTALTIDPKPTLLFNGPYSPGELLMDEPTSFFAPTPGGLYPLTYQWNKDGLPIPGAREGTFQFKPKSANDAGSYTVTISNAYGTVTSKPRGITVNTTPAPVVVTKPLTSQAPAVGANLLWWTYATGNPYPTFTWTRNGGPPSNVVTSNGSNGEAASSVQLTSGVQPEHTGIYEVTATSGDTSKHMTAILGVLSDHKTAGAATEVGHDIVHPNKNIYDQVLMTGAAAAVTADANQVTRVSFVDLTGDIVQVEFSGAGTLALVLDNAGSPAPAANYNQPGVQYVRGHPGIVVAGADETTNLSVFSVGRVTAVNQALFRDDVTYDGMADVAFIAITTTNGRFGGLRTANVRYYAGKGLTGVYAPGVTFAGPVYVGDIDAFDTATPVLVLKAAQDLRITGGDLQQTNGQPVGIGELTPGKFTAGTTSHGDVLPAQPNRAVFKPYDSP